MASAYAHPEYLVDTAWVASHLDDPAVRIVESDEDFLLVRFRAHPQRSQGRLVHHLAASLAPGFPIQSRFRKTGQ